LVKNSLMTCRGGVKTAVARPKAILSRRPTSEAIINLDQGVQVGSNDRGGFWREHDLEVSMSPRADC
jgi:hypothetical protein